MSLLAFILRAILFLVVFRLAGIVLRAFLSGFRQGSTPSGSPSRGRGSGSRSSPEPKGQIEELVKDPICGVHIARSAAIAGRYQGASASFCSEECAEKARASN